MKHLSTKTKATTLALLVCAQALLVGCATTTSTSSTSEEDQAKLAKAEKMANRFETRPRLGN